jgi:hypothetical protein
LAVFFLLATALSQAADDLAQLRVSATRAEVLAGRLVLSVPDQAESHVLQHGIMSAPESDYEQTRIVIDAGEQRMVLMVYEPFACAGPDLEGPAQKLTGHFSMRVRFQRWSLTAPLRALAYFPVVPAKDQEANSVMGVFVAGSDESVQNLEWYVNLPAASQFDTALRLAKSIARTIAPGTRTLDTTGSERALSAYSRTKSVFATIPQAYTVTAQPGPDFIVHCIHKIVTLGNENASIGVYLSNRPSSNRDGFVKEEELPCLAKASAGMKRWTTRFTHNSWNRRFSHA